MISFADHPALRDAQADRGVQEGKLAEVALARAVINTQILDLASPPAQGGFSVTPCGREHARAKLKATSDHIGRQYHETGCQTGWRGCGACCPCGCATARRRDQDRPCPRHIRTGFRGVFEADPDRVTAWSPIRDGRHDDCARPTIERNRPIEFACKDTWIKSGAARAVLAGTNGEDTVDGWPVEPRAARPSVRRRADGRVTTHFDPEITAKITAKIAAGFTAGFTDAFAASPEDFKGWARCERVGAQMHLLRGAGFDNFPETKAPMMPQNDTHNDTP